MPRGDRLTGDRVNIVWRVPLEDDDAAGVAPA
jgi:hypothetical protein